MSAKTISGLNLAHLASPTITLEVGPGKFPIRVPKLLLTEASPFFDNALNGKFMEAWTNILPFPTDEPDVVFRMVKWIITGELDSRNDVNDSWEGQEEECDEYYEECPNNDISCVFDDADTSSDDHTDSSAEEEEEPNNSPAPLPATGANALFRLWCLAERLLMPGLQDAVAQTLVASVVRNAYTGLGPVPNPPTLAFVYDNSAEQSRIRALAIDVAVVTWETAALKDLSAGLPVEIVTDLFVAATKYWRGETVSHGGKHVLFFEGAVHAYDVEGKSREELETPALTAPVCCHPKRLCRGCGFCDEWL
ncbi:hypothetical protein SLS55_004624 [Diplodia seriata]|uniref:BTB domain-containing protein n=1 Tax=Diplodia seriata TaxID=420778 RepID=A0ABR3CJY0_9PEZI